MKHVKLFEQFITENRVKSTRLLQDVINGNTSKAEGITLSKEMAEHMLNWVNTSPYGKKYSDLPLHKLIKASFSWGIERGLDPKLKGELETLRGSIKESLTESHFVVGDQVTCIKSGMNGEVISLDKEDGADDEKYYTVKREDGKEMKYAPSELKLNESIDVKYWADYNDDTSGQGKKEFAEKSTKFNKDFFNKAMNSWNSEAELGSTLRPFSETYSKIYKMAKEFYKKAGWISVNVIHAMIMQES
jgi:hypothetical protein